MLANRPHLLAPLLTVLVALAGLALASGAGAAQRTGVAPGSATVRCGNPNIVRGTGVWRAAEAFDVRDHRTGAAGVVQAIWHRRTAVEVRVCDAQGLVRADLQHVMTAGKGLRELVWNTRICRGRDGIGSETTADREYEAPAVRRARLRRAVRLGDARIVRLGDGRRVIVADDHLPVPTARTIDSRNWLAGCVRPGRR